MRGVLRLPRVVPRCLALEALPPMTSTRWQRPEHGSGEQVGQDRKVRDSMARQSSSRSLANGWCRAKMRDESSDGPMPVTKGQSTAGVNTTRRASTRERMSKLLEATSAEAEAASGCEP